MKSLEKYPGLPGLFVSAIFSGALSTLSSGFNSLSAITLQDIVKGYIAADLTEQRATFIAKCLGDQSNPAFVGIPLDFQYSMGYMYICFSRSVWCAVYRTVISGIIHGWSASGR